jgi:hypothetical protein
MTTDNSYPTTHTHVQSRTSGGKTASGGLHTHTTAAQDQAISDLAARVTKLEGGVVVPPPPLPLPAAPTGLKAVAGDGLVTFTWNAVP